MSDPNAIMTVPEDPPSSSGTTYVLTMGGYDYVLLTEGTSVAWAFSTTPGSHLRFRETNGGAVHLQDATSGNYLRLNANHDGFEMGDEETALTLVPKTVDGKLQLHYIHSSGNQWVGKSQDPIPMTTDRWALLVEAAASNWSWEPHPTNAPTGTEAWRRTYNADNHFSPFGFLRHVQLVVQHQDVQHTGDDYWDGLSALNPANNEPYSSTILGKIDGWLTGDFDVAQHGTAATQAMKNAAKRFYTSVESELNELDPKVPPDWPGIDDELGKDPYPG